MKAKNRLGLVFFPAFDWAISMTHPEREERLLYTMDQLLEEGIHDIPGIDLYNPSIAENKDIERVHFTVPNVDKRVSESHKVSIGGNIKAFDLVCSGEADKAFALVRPPGHHAHKVVYGDRGFCIVNVEAVALEHLRHNYGPKRVAIVDTDCHHGDGTEDIYWNDRDTLFISFHQDGRTLFPSTGYLDDLGGPAAYGYNLNIPLPPGTGDEGMLYILNEVVMPILREYRPELLINSAGQDNHYTDPLTNMNFSAQGYALLNEILNPDICVLEGGYSIEGALPYVNLGIILAMAGLDYSGVREPDYDEKDLRQDARTTEYIKRIGEAVLQRWQNRETLREKFIGKAEYIEKKKRIFYDTDMIMEYQTKQFKVCEECQGFNYIDSRTDRGEHIFAVELPANSCAKCRDLAYEKFSQAKKERGRYTNVYLQDHEEDLYLFA